MAQRKKPSQKALVAKADALFSVIVRAPGFCMNCGATQNLQCAHGFSRRYRNTRWDERNGFALDRACHVYFTHRPIEWDDWMLKRMGLTMYEEVRALALSTQKVDVSAVLARLIVRSNELASA